MKRMIWQLVLFLGLWAAGIVPACAETAMIEVMNLPLEEAANAARAELSATGVVTTLPSRHMLILKDDASHIQRARKLLRRLDTPAPALLAEAEMLDTSEDRESSIHAPVRLQGGWARVRFESEEISARHRTRLMLRLTSGRPGRMEIGTIYPAREPVRELLHRHGWADTPDFSQIPVTAGFDILARRVDQAHARVRITPWFERLEQAPAARGQIEILPDLGTTDRPRTPPDATAPMRLNLQPTLARKRQRIVVTEAETELTVPLNKAVTLAAVHDAARDVGMALLAHRASIGQRTLLLRLKISAASP